MIENAPYGIYRAEASGKLLLVNPALQRMLGYESRDELLRVNLGQLTFIAIHGTTKN